MVQEENKMSHTTGKKEVKSKGHKNDKIKTTHEEDMKKQKQII